MIINIPTGREAEIAEAIRRFGGASAGNDRAVILEFVRSKFIDLLKAEARRTAVTSLPEPTLDLTEGGGGPA